MSDQATMNGHTNGKSPATGVGHNLAGLSHDLIALVELQCQLVAVDAREATSRAILPIVMIAGATLLALGTMPVVLLGIGWALVNLAGFTHGAAFLTVSLIALIAAAGSALWGWTRLKAAIAVMKRSQRELTQNVRWVKQALLRKNTRSELYRQRV